MTTALALNTLKSATGVGSALCIGGAFIKGQKFGNPFDFLKGVIGLKQEDYYEEYGTNSGTTMEALGGTTDNFISAGVAAAARGSKTILKIAKDLGLKASQVRKSALIAAPALVGWQAIQGVDEVKNGDGDPVKDKLDATGNILNIIMLSMALKKGNLKKAWALIHNTAKRFVK